MDKNFHPSSIESHLYDAWEKAGYFKPSGVGEPYSIPLPPPNVTGILHMGHGFQDVLMDMLTRYHPMMGRNVLWQPGIDHAGIATQIVVERQLQQLGQTRHDLGRDLFVKKIWAWKEASGDAILSQMKRLGASADWSRTHFTLDASQTRATLKTFVKLYQEGLIYKGVRLVNWDPVLKTALSDLEVISEELVGSLWHIRYPIDGSGETLVIATTRPETLLGDTAVAVHPDDARYQHLIGKEILLPLANRRIPIIADAYVDLAFGSGCVKVTPAHDFNDYAIGKRHDLAMLNIFSLDATLNGSVPECYQGLDRFEARKRILTDLEQQGLLVKTEPHTLKIPKSERTGAIVEPLLSPQWYVRIQPLADPAIQAVREGRIKFIPENASHAYYRWMEDIQDWCISRQLWWGHPIPAWYDPQGNVYVGLDEAAVRAEHQLPSDLVLTQDPDVFDTWFTSALWPFASLDWPDSTAMTKTFYPTSTLVTGFDIIFFWVARMIMFGLKMMNDVPFKEVYVHGLIRDHEGQKMSKSKGNVLDPIDLIDGVDLETLIQKRTTGLLNPKQADKVIKDTRKNFPHGISAYGCDALRFTYAALASTSRDINFSVDRLEGYRNFCNKLWNSARFITLQIEQIGYDAQAPRVLSPPDLWITAALNKLVTQVHQNLAEYRFDLLAQTLYEFVWNEFCDWYLEFSKVSLQKDRVTTHQQGTLYTLIHTLETLLRLAHPLIPFITETIWQDLRPYHQYPDTHLMITAFPHAQPATSGASDQEQEILWLRNIITHIRTLRSELNLSPAKPVELFLKDPHPHTRTQLNALQPWLQALSKVSQLTWISDASTLGACATAQWGTLEIYLPLKGLIDFDAERARLLKEITQASVEIEKINQKLANPEFKGKAPAPVLAKTEAQKADLEAHISLWQRELKKLG